MRNVDWLVQDLHDIDSKEDRRILHEKLFDVNMRLFRGNKAYKNLVLGVVAHMEGLLGQKPIDYTPIKGISGANVGIPFNIIGFIKNGIKTMMLNPKIVKASQHKTTVLSNCGSLRLVQPIKVERNNLIFLEWYDIEGIKHQGSFDRQYGGFTIQHEVDHNLGVMINDPR